MLNRKPAEFILLLCLVAPVMPSTSPGAGFLTDLTGTAIGAEYRRILKGPWKYQFSHGNIRKTGTLTLPVSWADITGTPYGTMVLSGEIRIPPGLQGVNIQVINGRQFFDLRANGKNLISRNKYIHYGPIHAEIATHGILRLEYRMSNPQDRQGSRISAPVILSDGELQLAENYYYYPALFLLGLILLAGVYQLIIFLFRPREKSSLLLSIFCFLMTLRVLQENGLFNSQAEWTGIPQLYYSYFTYYAAVPVFAAFLRTTFPAYYGRPLFLILLGISTAFVLMLLSPVSFASRTLIPHQIYSLLTILWGINGMIRGSLRKDLKAMISLSGFLLFAVAIVMDIRALHSAEAGLPAFHGGFALFLLAQVTVISYGNMQARKTAEYLSENLRKEVDHQTAHLQRKNLEISSIMELAILVQNSTEEDLRKHVAEFFSLSYENAAHTSLALLTASMQLKPLNSAEQSGYRDFLSAFPADFIPETGTVLHGTREGFITSPKGIRLEISVPFPPETGDILIFPLVASGSTVGVMAVFFREVIDSKHLKSGWENLPLRLSLLLSGPVYRGALLQQELKKRAKLTASNRRMEADLKKAELQLVQAEKLSSLGELVASIAHEINNPANYISAAASNLARTNADLGDFLHRLAGDDPDAAEILSQFDGYTSSISAFISDISTGVRSITEINGALRSYSRIDPDPIKGVDIGSVLSDALVILRGKVKYFTVETEFTHSNFISGHPSQLGQVFTNLVSNASDALMEKREKNPDFSGKIMIRTEDTDQGVRVTISDNGPGIPEEIKRSVFDPFFTTKSSGKGTGLGLAIVKKILAKHGARVRISDVPGGGAAFILDFNKDE